MNSMPADPNPRRRATLATSATFLAELGEADGGDERWSVFVSRYRPVIASYLLRAGLPRQDVDDGVQEVLATLARRLPDWHYDPTRGSFRGYVKTIARHHACRRLAKAARDAVRAVGGSEQQAAIAQLKDGFAAEQDERFEREWQRHVLDLACDDVRRELSPRQWSMFRRVQLEHESAQAVADDLGATRNAVDVACYNVRKRLRAKVNRLDDPSRF